MSPAPRAETEWIFQREGQVLGPVPVSRLREMLFAGEVDANTPVSRDGGSFRPIGDVPALLVDLRKAEASLRVQREVAQARRRVSRRRLLRGGVAAAIVLVLLGAGIGGAVWLAASRRETRSALLDDFGPGIALSVPARIGSGRARDPEAGPEEVAVPLDPAKPRTVRAARERAPAPRPAAGGIVEANWDAAELQAVVARQQRTLAPCLRAEATRSPGFAGEIPIEFAVQNDGRVGALWVDEPRFRRGPLLDCLRAALQGEGWRFRPFSGEQPVVALTFRIGGS